MTVGKERKLGSRAGPARALFLGPMQGLMTEAGREGATVGAFLHFHNLLWLLSADIGVFLLNYWETGTLSSVIYKMICLIP